jgi:hypothetical protein
MKSRTHLAILAALSLAVAAIPRIATCRNPLCRQCAAPNKPTIQAAVNASSQGDTVLVCPGTYPEQVTITKNLTLQGLVVGTAGQVVITPPAAGVVTNTYDLYPKASGGGAGTGAECAPGGVEQHHGGWSGQRHQWLRPRYPRHLLSECGGTIENVTTRNQVLVNGSEGLIGCQSGQGIFVQTGYGTSSTPQYVAILATAFATSRRTASRWMDRR